MNHFTPFKKFDHILNNKTLLIAEKIFALIELWTTIAEFDGSELNLNQTVDLVDWALLHTMNIALTAEWTHYMDLFETQLLNSIEKASTSICKVSKGFEKRFDKIVYVIKETWTSPVLDVIIKTEDLDINSDVVEFFRKEQAHLISVRLIKLCESKCEDLALNLAMSFLKYLRLMGENGEKVKITQDQISFIFDIKISLLYKWGKIKAFENAVSKMSCEESYACINRFLHKKPNLLKIWKYSQKIATSIMQILLENIVVHNRTDQRELLRQILETYLRISTATDWLEELCPKIRKLCELAESSMLQTICDVLKKVDNRDLDSFIVEIFIKAITADMNDLEIFKIQKQDEKLGGRQNDGGNEASTIVNRLAELFCSLAEFMDNKVKVARECVLTAFSLQPTAERLALLESFAKRSGLQVLDPSEMWKCKDHPLSSNYDNQLWECPDCHEYMCKPQLDIPMKANLALYEAVQTLDLPETICEDLIICISNPRYQVLSWYLPWVVLYRLCVMYLKDPQRTREYVTELNFVDIDYSQFDDIPEEPLDPFAGVEKGYEKYLNKDYDEEKDEESSTNEECAIDGDDYDPNSMESLKRIMSLQNVEEEDEASSELEEECVGKKEEISQNWTPSSSVQSSLLEERDDKDDVKRPTTERLKNLKRKLCFFRKEKGKKKVAKDIGIESAEGGGAKVSKRSRCPIFGKKKK